MHAKAGRRFRVQLRNLRAGAETGHRPARLRSPAGSTADGEARDTGFTRVSPKQKSFGSASRKARPVFEKTPQTERRKATRFPQGKREPIVRMRLSVLRPSPPSQAGDGPGPTARAAPARRDRRCLKIEGKKAFASQLYTQLHLVNCYLSSKKCTLTGI